MVEYTCTFTFDAFIFPEESVRAALVEGLSAMFKKHFPNSVLFNVELKRDKSEDRALGVRK
jgi:hypothetical protein